MPPLAAPAHVFLDVFIECNLRCVHCDIFKLKSPPGEMSMDQRKGVVREIGRNWPETRLVLTGGELFLRRERLYELGATCRTEGVYTTVSSNGTIMRQPDFERLPHSGINCVVLSVDSDQPEVHDRLRGAQGTFDRVVRQTVPGLVKARKRTSEDFTVLTSTILGAHNLHRIDEMVDLFENLEVDTVLFQPIQPVFAREMRSRWWEEEALFPKDKAAVDSGIDRLIALRLKGRRLYQTPEQFEDMRYYFHHPQLIRPGQCASMDRHLMVDLFGDVRLCFHMERVGMKPVGSIRKQSLKEIWVDAQTETARQRLRLCREGCGTMCCHAR